MDKITEYQVLSSGLQHSRERNEGKVYTKWTTFLLMQFSVGLTLSLKVPA